MTTVSDLDVPKSRAPYKKIAAVRFTVLSPDEITQQSVCEVVNPNTYEGGLPTYGGLNDPRMGPIDYQTPCDTCSMNMDNCPGHFGHIVLAQPMFSWGFLKTTLSCLRCVCYYCSRLLTPYDDLGIQKAQQSKNMKQRLAHVFAFLLILNFVLFVRLRSDLVRDDLELVLALHSFRRATMGLHAATHVLCYFPPCSAVVRSSSRNLIYKNHHVAGVCSLPKQEAVSVCNGSAGNTKRGRPVLQ